MAAALNMTASRLCEEISFEELELMEKAYVRKTFRLVDVMPEKLIAFLENFFGYKKKFSITAKMTGCGVAIVDNQRVRCPHYFEHVNGTSKLWAGTAVWNK